jgi:pyroglutamyl-peptidase
MKRTKHAIDNAPDLRPNVLLTGFGPFPGVAENISGRLAKDLAGRATREFPAYHFAHAVLPTEWQAAPNILAALVADLKPALMLLFGVAADARGFRIETEGANVCRASPDAAGLPPLAPILVHGAQAAYSATLPIDAIVRRLTAQGFPVTISNDAGGYLCNAALYHALHALSEPGHSCRAGFIHIPSDLSPDVSDPPLTFERAIEGSLEIIRVSLEGLSV